MNKLEFNHPGGFPLETQTLEKMQEAWSCLGLLASGFGENVILSGCEITYHGYLVTYPFDVAPGIMVVNGEVVPFIGGRFEGKVDREVKIIETTETITLKDGTQAEFYKKRKAVPCGIGEGVPFFSFRRIKNLKELTAEINKKVDKVSGKGLSSNDFTNQHLGLLPKLHLLIDANADIVENRGVLQDVEVSSSGSSAGWYVIDIKRDFPSDAVFVAKTTDKQSYANARTSEVSGKHLIVRAYSSGGEPTDNRFRLIAWW